MKLFDKFKNQIRHKNSELPEGFGWEDMQDGIFAKMGEEKETATARKMPLQRILFIGLISVIGILSISYLMVQSTKETSLQHSQNINTNEKASASQNVSSIEDSIEEVKETNVGNNAQRVNNISESHTSSIHNTLHLDSNETITSKKQRIALNNYSNSDDIHSNRSKADEANQGLKESKNQENNTIQSSDVGDQNLGRQVENKDSKSNTASNSVVAESKSESKVTNSFAFKKIGKSKENPTISKVETNDDYALTQRPLFQFPLLKSKDNHIISHTKLFELTNSTLTPTPIIKKGQQALWNFELASGFNNWSYTLKNDLEPSSLYDNTYSEYGYSYSVRLERNFTRRFSLASGIDMDMMYRRLVLKHTHLQERLEKGVLLKYTKNAISGDLSNHIYGDTIVQDTVYSTLTNYNKFQVISVPIVANYNILNNNSWSVDIGIGPSISFLTTYSGKYINNDDLMSYDNSSNLYNTSPKVALLANLRLRKWLSNNYYLGMRLDFKNHFSSWGNQANSDITPRITSGSVVIGKSF